MSDDSANLSSKTFSRALEAVNKVGYMDGASNGQRDTFQLSFNTGYKQGLNFGLQLGFNEANIRIRKLELESRLTDPRRINCQICLNNTTMQESTVNLFNIQKEKNDVVFFNFNMH